MYKRNRMIVTNPVVSRKDPTFNTTTYDWAPAGLNQKLVRISEKYETLVVCMKLQFVGLYVKPPSMFLTLEDTESEQRETTIKRRDLHDTQALSYTTSKHGQSHNSNEHIIFSRWLRAGKKSCVYAN